MIEQAIKAGRAAAKARDLSLKLVRPGAKILDVAERIEEEIRKQGCDVGFPCNVSINEIAAHDTARVDDSRLIKKGDLVKIDIGACFEGVLSDTARTVHAGSSKNPEIIKCVEECMKEALKVIMPGEKISGVGSAVQAVADKYDYKIVKNLVGHGLGEYAVHTGMSIPNYRNSESGVFENGNLVAVEPYVTKGAGKASGMNRTEIFALKRVKTLRIRKARQILDWVVKERKTLPFCRRWLKGFGHQLDFILSEMVRQGVLHAYPVLKETGKKPVAQRENTILILDKPVITTK